MLSRELAEVVSAADNKSGCQELQVRLGDSLSKAMNYIALSGPAAAGDAVVVNTTAQNLKLGSGGYHFVIYNLSRPTQELRGAGHIMKLRYTPLQMRVLAVEEEESPFHAAMRQAQSLEGMPVVVAELHSMLAPLALSVHQKKPGVRLAYVMTDGGALPAFFSRALRELRERGLICGTVTTGHAFGGELEAVNVYSGLLAAKSALGADAVVVSMGPGVAGTGTPYGFSGIETADNINRTVALGGRPLMVPRISFADKRERHQGLSHHTLTALGWAALGRADVPLPVLEPQQDEVLSAQVEAAGLREKHNIHRYYDLTLAHLQDERHLCSTMGRSLDDDSAFFLAVTGAARHLCRLLSAGGSE